MLNKYLELVENTTLSPDELYKLAWGDNNLCLAVLLSGVKPTGALSHRVINVVEKGATLRAIELGIKVQRQHLGDLHLTYKNNCERTRLISSDEPYESTPMCALLRIHEIVVKDCMKSSVSESEEHEFCCKVTVDEELAFEYNIKDFDTFDVSVDNGLRTLYSTIKGKEKVKINVVYGLKTTWDQCVQDVFYLESGESLWETYDEYALK